MNGFARLLYLPLLLFVPHSLFAQTTTPDTTVQVVDRLFDGWRGTGTPGCAVGVSRSGQPLLERAYGMANLETGTPNQTSTIFHAGSIAKQFTAMAVMLLVHDGKLALDDDVRKFIPELPDYGRPITVRHLLTHTSGLRDFFELLIFARGRFEEERITDADMMDIVTRQKALNLHPRHRVPVQQHRRPGVLAEYAGSYCSVELNSTYQVSVVDSMLVLRTGTSSGNTARPVFGDTFVSGQLTIEFDRVKGKVSGFRLTHPRARNIAFTRVK